MTSRATAPPSANAATSSTGNMVRAKSASVALTEYEEPKVVSRFSDICNSIRGKSEEELGFNAVDVTQRGLSLLTGQLRLFMETVLGVNSDPSRRTITKFPHKLFSDYSPDGALEIILSTCLRFKSSSGLRRLDFQNADKQSLYLDMLRLVEKNLDRAGFLPGHRIYFSSKVPSGVVSELRRIVANRAKVVSSAANASHIIYPDPKGTTPAETDGTDYCRTLEVAGPHALVHWWYHPDSYDSWIPSADVQGDPEPEAVIQGPWHVQIRWLRDTEVFNEWVNELDYEVPEELRDASAVEAVALKEKKKKGDRNSSDIAGKKASKKRKRHESAAEKNVDGEYFKRRTDQDKELRVAMSPSIGSKKSEEISDDLDGSVSRDVEFSSDGERLDADDGETLRNQQGVSRDVSQGDDPSIERNRENDQDVRRQSSNDKERNSGHRDRERDKSRGRERDRSRDRRERRDRDRQRNRQRRSNESESSSKPMEYDDVSVSDVVGVPERTERSMDGEEKARHDPSTNSAPPENRDGSDDGKPSKRVKVIKVDRSGSGSESPSFAQRMNMKRRRSITGESEYSSDSDDKAPGPVSAIKVRVKMSGPSKVILGESGSAESKGAGKKDSRTPEHDETAGVAQKEESLLSPGDVHIGMSMNDASDGVEKSSRKAKTKKRDRRVSHPRNVGVSPVEDADPIPESEVRRIRNISMDVSAQLPNPSVHGDGLRSTSGRGKTMCDENASAEHAPSESVTHRATAVASNGVSGKAAGAPVSVADLVESLPSAPVRIPAQSRWFRVDSIHDLEKRSLPEFFSCRSASKTPRVYKLYRDFMIDAWRQAPNRYLTATSVRRHLAGDVCAILRVHAFLEHWGLINFGVKPESRPHHASMKGIRAEYWNAAPISDQPTHSGSPSEPMGSGVPRLLLFDEVPLSQKSATGSTLKNAAGGAQGSTKGGSSLATRREVYASAAALTYNCDACGKDCSRMRYHCVGQADINLCPSCFADGRYPTSLSARDFEQLTTVASSDAYDGTVWSEAEALLLLEGLEQFGDDWNSVAKHVGTKTNEQCVQQFLRMPIEDSFLGDQIGKWGMGSGDKSAADLAASGEHVFAAPPAPFADSANPVMAQIAFLASSVSPEVAAAAAQAALKQIMAETNHLARPTDNTVADRKQLAQALVQNRTPPSSANGPLQSRNSPSQVGKAKPVHVNSSALPAGPTAMKLEAVEDSAFAKSSDASAGSLANATTHVDKSEQTRTPGRIVPNSIPRAVGSVQNADQRSQVKQGISNLPVAELDAAAVEASAAVGLAAAAARARELADAEIREIERIFAVVVETKLRIIDEKMQSFAKLESFMRSERDRLERERQALYADRVSAALARAGGNDTRLQVADGVSDHRFSSPVPPAVLSATPHAVHRAVSAAVPSEVPQVIDPALTTVAPSSISPAVAPGVPIPMQTNASVQVPAHVSTESSSVAPRMQ